MTRRADFLTFAPSVPALFEVRFGGVAGDAHILHLPASLLSKAQHRMAQVWTWITQQEHVLAQVALLRHPRE